MKFYLIPRLNYNFSLRDFVISLKGIFQREIDKSKIYKLFNNDDIFFTNHARTGLRLLLNSMDLPENARIGVQILNCHTIFNAVRNSGYKHVFIDINDNLTISLDDLKRKVGLIDALIVTNIFGIPADVEKIKEIVKDIPVIEDCAHSFLTGKNGKLTGTFFDAAIFSFGKAKFPSIGKGGFVVINKKAIVPGFKKKLSGLGSNSFANEVKNIIESLIFKIIYNRFVYRIFNGFIKFSFIKNLSDKLQLNHNTESSEREVLKSNLSLFINKIDKYELYKNKQAGNAFRLKEYLKQFKNLEQVEIDDNSSPNYIMFPVITESKSELIKTFLEHGVETGAHFAASISWAEELGYKKNDCPNAERIIPRLVLLPTYRSIMNLN